VTMGIPFRESKRRAVGISVPLAGSEASTTVGGAAARTDLVNATPLREPFDLHNLHAMYRALTVDRSAIRNYRVPLAIRGASLVPEAARLLPPNCVRCLQDERLPDAARITVESLDRWTALHPVFAERWLYWRRSGDAQDLRRSAPASPPGQAAADNPAPPSGLIEIGRAGDVQFFALPTQAHLLASLVFLTLPASARPVEALALAPAQASPSQRQRPSPAPTAQDAQPPQVRVPSVLTAPLPAPDSRPNLQSPLFQPFLIPRR